ncbi:hypothetical protein Tco_0455926 [Tanacetum coccineum]
MANRLHRHNFKWMVPVGASRLELRKSIFQFLEEKLECRLRITMLGSILTLGDWCLWREADFGIDSQKTADVVIKDFIVILNHSLKDC